MITVLALAYVLLVIILIHKKKVPNSVLTWMTVPVWIIFLFFVLYVPMMIGAPSGQARLMTYSLGIGPNVSGQVIEVNVEPNVLVKEGDVLFRLDPRPYQYALRGAQAQLVNAQQASLEIKANYEAAIAAAERAESIRDLAKENLDRFVQGNKGKTKPFAQQQIDSAIQTLKANEAALKQAYAVRTAAKLAADVQLDGLDPSVILAQSAVDQATYSLEETTVVAPSDGYVTAFDLRVGQRLAGSPQIDALSFIEDTPNIVFVKIAQIFHRHIKVGQIVDVTFKTRPGHTFSGIVEGVPIANALGEGAIGGRIPVAAPFQVMPFSVRIRLDDVEAVKNIPAGSVGTAAIYTDTFLNVQTIQRVTIRITSFTNFLFPQM